MSTTLNSIDSSQKTRETRYKYKSSARKIWTNGKSDERGQKLLMIFFAILFVIFLSEQILPESIDFLSMRKTLTTGDQIVSPFQLKKFIIRKTLFEIQMKIVDQWHWTAHLNTQSTRTTTFRDRSFRSLLIVFEFLNRKHFAFSAMRTFSTTFRRISSIRRRTSRSIQCRLGMCVVVWRNVGMFAPRPRPTNDRTLLY